MHRDDVMGFLKIASAHFEVRHGKMAAQDMQIPENETSARASDARMIALLEALQMSASYRYAFDQVVNVEKCEVMGIGAMVGKVESSENFMRLPRVSEKEAQRFSELMQQVSGQQATITAAGDCEDVGLFFSRTMEGFVRGLERCKHNLSPVALAYLSDCASRAMCCVVLEAGAAGKNVAFKPGGYHGIAALVPKAVLKADNIAKSMTDVIKNVANKEPIEPVHAGAIHYLEGTCQLWPDQRAVEKKLAGGNEQECARRLKAVQASVTKVFGKGYNMKSGDIGRLMKQCYGAAQTLLPPPEEMESGLKLYQNSMQLHCMTDQANAGVGGDRLQLLPHMMYAPLRCDTPQEQADMKLLVESAVEPPWFTTNEGGHETRVNSSATRMAQLIRDGWMEAGRLGGTGVLTQGDLLKAQKSMKATLKLQAPEVAVRLALSNLTANSRDGEPFPSVLHVFIQAV
jgi:hypothetical protein